MPRCEKSRRVCREPQHTGLWRGTGAQEEKLTVEELEALRLCDLEGLSQDEAGSRMDISRGTFQRILYRARKKVASALVNGHNITIGGGNYQLADCSCECMKQCADCGFKTSSTKASANSASTGK